ncbi:MAG: GNAT family N-acetyltransferase [Myxococcota bacterium]
MAASRFITLNEENIHEHHVCCALGDRKHEAGVARKKAWLKRRFKEGLVFRKPDERGTCFIECVPSAKAWRPIEAPGWITIHCLWVSGRFANQGHGRTLVEGCIADAKRQKKSGVVVAAAKTKRPFLSDPKFLRRSVLSPWMSGASFASLRSLSTEGRRDRALREASVKVKETRARPLLRATPISAP